MKCYVSKHATILTENKFIYKNHGKKAMSIGKYKCICINNYVPFYRH